MKMKKINLKRPRVNKKKVYLVTTVALFTLISVSWLTYTILIAVNNFFDTHYIQRNDIVKIELRKPFEIKERETPVAEVIRVVEEIPHPEDLETDVEVAIYEKWGLENYKLAIAVAKAESGLNPEAINVNTNGSIDLGLFQINSTHYEKDECSLEKVVTVEGNIDCAYSLWEAQGWEPWVAFNNGGFIDHID